MVGALVGEGVGVGRAVGSGTVRNCRGVPNLFATVPAVVNLFTDEGARFAMFARSFARKTPLSQLAVNLVVKALVALEVLLYEKSSNVNLTFNINSTLARSVSRSLLVRRRFVAPVTITNEPRSAFSSLSVMANKVVSTSASCTPTTSVMSGAVMDDSD